jgi:hypothetical protein
MLMARCSAICIHPRYVVKPSIKKTALMSRLSVQFERLPFNSVSMFPVGFLSCVVLIVPSTSMIGDLGRSVLITIP